MRSFFTYKQPNQIDYSGVRDVEALSARDGSHLGGANAGLVKTTIISISRLCLLQKQVKPRRTRAGISSSPWRNFYKRSNRHSRLFLAGDFAVHGTTLDGEHFMAN